MKTTIAKHRGVSGAILVTTLCILAVLTFSMVFYLMMLRDEQASVARDQAWTRALIVAEAGVDEALAQANRNGVTGKAPTYTGWTQSGGIYLLPSAPRNIYGGSYNAAILPGTVTVLSIPYYTNTIRSTGIVSAPLKVGQTISRAIEVTSTRAPVFQVALAVRTTVNLNGNKLTVDSYDSSDLVHFTNGLWNAANRHAHGDVASATNTGAAFTLGNANIMGKLHTAPGGNQADVNFKKNSSVGDVTWVTAGTSGIESGYFVDDLNSVFPDVAEPYTSGASMPSTNYIPAGSYYINGDYTLANNATLMVATNQYVEIYVTGNLDLKNNSSIIVPYGSTLQIYVGGPNVSLGVINNLGNANSFKILGLTNTTSVTLNGNNTFVGTIYAPEAAFTANGGGSGPQDVQGALVVNSATLTGTFNIHYDENLARSGLTGIFIANTWREL